MNNRPPSLAARLLRIVAFAMLPLAIMMVLVGASSGPVTRPCPIAAGSSDGGTALSTSASDGAVRVFHAGFSGAARWHHHSQ